MWIETSESWGLWGFPGCGRLPDSPGLDPTCVNLRRFLSVSYLPSLHGQGLY